MTGEWNGRNHLGVILTTCRNKINRELFTQQSHGEAAHSMSGQYNPPSFPLTGNQSIGITEIKHQGTLTAQYGYPPPPMGNSTYIPPVNHNQDINRSLQQVSQSNLPSSGPYTQHFADSPSSTGSFTQGQRNLGYDPNLSPMFAA